MINTPVTLEFFGLNSRALVTENDLEQAILDHLENFLLEMGTGFCFEGRQKRLLIDDEEYVATASISPDFSSAGFYKNIPK